jgi:hypothetical protein
MMVLFLVKNELILDRDHTETQKNSWILCDHLLTVIVNYTASSTSEEFLLIFLIYFTLVLFHCIFICALSL